ncbi:MAG: hypothetical protein AAFV88_18135 [Planctomycetota bacterium]
MAFLIASTTLAQSRLPAGDRSDFAGKQASLRTLPPMRALPIGTDEGRTASAFQAPAYLDIEAFRKTATLRSVEFGDQKHGVAVGDYGCILVTGDGGQTWRSSDISVHCTLYDVAWANARTVLVVGGAVDAVTKISRAVVLLSQDAGNSWGKLAEHDLPRLLQADFRDNRWMAWGDADPVTGMTRFESRDGGNQWQAVSETYLQSSLVEPAGGGRPTQETLASLSAKSKRIGVPWMVRSSVEIDNDTRVVVGDFGNISRSVDGGASWTSATTFHRCAILCLAGEARTIPWALLGRETLENRWQTKLVVGSANSAPSSSLTQAASCAGVASVDVCDEKDADARLRSMIEWIDLLKPAILVIDRQLNPGERAKLTQHAVSRGTGAVVTCARGGRGDAMLHDGGILMNTGVLVGDIDFDCRFWVDASSATHFRAAANQFLAISMSYGGGSGAVRGNSLAAGLSLSESYAIAPHSHRTSKRRSQVLQARLKQQRQIDRALQQPDSSLGLLLDQTASEDRFRFAWTLLGRADSSVLPVVSDLMLERFPDRSASHLMALRAALVSQSVEHKRMQQQKPLVGFVGDAPVGGFGDLDVDQVDYQSGAEVSQQLMPGDGGHSVVVSPFQETAAPVGARSRIVQATARSLTRPATSAPRPIVPSVMTPGSSGRGGLDLRWQMHPVRQLMEKALAATREPVQTAEKTSVSLAADATAPESQSVMEEVSTVSSEPAEPVLQRDSLLDANLQRVAESGTPWASLLRPRSAQVVQAKRAIKTPRLDGIFDEAVWNRSDAFAITRTTQPIFVSVAFDDDYVFLAIRKAIDPDTASVSDGPMAGKRDSVLVKEDRIGVGFDLDRDLVTHYEIQFTRHGQTRDLIDQATDWNPTWYVATHRTDQWQAAEIAIERSSFAPARETTDGEAALPSQWFLRVRSLAAGTADPVEWMPDAATRLRVDFGD